MKESVIGFIKDTAHLSETEKAKKLDEYVLMQIENLILYVWSDETERERELKCAREWWNVVEEEEDGCEQ